jgi:hypothetical protein
MNLRVWSSWLTTMLCALLFSGGAIAGDFNGDGKADVLWRQNGTGITSMWLMNGAAFTGAGGWTVPTDWVIQGMGDFNGDGKTDVLWRQNGTGITSMWLMNGAAFTGAGGWPMPTDWVIQGVGDFNGDGKADILWRQNGTGITSIWLMNGGGAYTAAGGWAVPTDWVIQGIGDFNGDGKADVLWRQNGTGITSMWLMNGATFTGAGGWTVPTDWVIQTPAPTSLTLTWQYNSSNETGFRIERSPDGLTNWTEIATTGPNITSYQDARLTPGTAYYYRVRAYNTTDTSAYSDVKGATTH